VTINQKVGTLTVENQARQIEETYTSFNFILFKLRVRINHKEYPEYDIVHTLIIF
jgi:hypothetical protein